MLRFESDKQSVDLLIRNDFFFICEAHNNLAEATKERMAEDEIGKFTLKLYITDSISIQELEFQLKECSSQ